MQSYFLDVKGEGGRAVERWNLEIIRISVDLKNAEIGISSHSVQGSLVRVV